MTDLLSWTWSGSRCGHAMIISAHDDPRVDLHDGSFQVLKLTSTVKAYMRNRFEDPKSSVEARILLFCQEPSQSR